MENVYVCVLTSKFLVSIKQSVKILKVEMRRICNRMLLSMLTL